MREPPVVGLLYRRASTAKFYRLARIIPANRGGPSYEFRAVDPRNAGLLVTDASLYDFERIEVDLDDWRDTFDAPGEP